MDSKFPIWLFIKTRKVKIQHHLMFGLMAEGSFSAGLPLPLPSQARGGHCRTATCFQPSERYAADTIAPTPVLSPASNGYHHIAPTAFSTGTRTLSRTPAGGQSRPSAPASRSSKGTPTPSRTASAQLLRARHAEQMTQNLLQMRRALVLGCHLRPSLFEGSCCLAARSLQFLPPSRSAVTQGGNHKVMQILCE